MRKQDQAVCRLPGADGGVAVGSEGGACAQATDDFFIHLHDRRAMANVTISSVHNGAVEISIQLETAEELPLKAEASPSPWATRTRASSGDCQGTTDRRRPVVGEDGGSEAGRWNFALGITLAPTDTVNIASPI